MEKEITMEELVKMVNESSGEIIIHVELGAESGFQELFLEHMNFPLQF